MEILEEGTILQQKYRVLKTVGSGGMGAVYLTHGENLGKDWAVKEMIDIFSDEKERESAINQFRTEARILANLHHPNLPRVVDYFEEKGKHYLVMDFIEGKTLKEIVEESESPISCDDMIEWAITIAQTLHYLHTQNPPIIFRDLKPSNVMMARGGEIKLIDFGISKIFIPQEITRTGAKGMGSPGFCAPEQYGESPTDARSDVYSLGALIYYLAMKRNPPDAIELLLGKTALQQVETCDPNFTGALSRIVKKAMEIRQEDRFQTARDICDALSLLTSNKVETTSPESEKKGCPLDISPEKIAEAFRGVFVKKLKWKEDQAPGFDLSYSSGILEKQIVLIKLLSRIDEASLLNFIDTALMWQKETTGRMYHPKVKAYFLCIGHSISSLSEVLRLSEANTVSSLALRQRFFIPVAIDKKEVYDTHIPESFKDSNDLRNVFLNIRIAVNNII